MEEVYGKFRSVSRLISGNGEREKREGGREMSILPASYLYTTCIFSVLCMIMEMGCFFLCLGGQSHMGMQ